MSANDTLIVAAGEPFLSLAELKREHIEVIRATRSRTEGDEDKQKRIARIKDFMRRAQATGSRIEDLSDRDIAQSILDYWAGELLALGVRERGAYGHSTLAVFDETKKVDISQMGSPYIGLRPFDESDSPWFFGRSQVTQRLCQKILQNRLVIVYGPSGAGKTSLVVAGLTPQLKDGVGIAGSEKWRYTPAFTPDADPIAALLSAVCPSGTDATAWVASQKPSFELKPDRLESLLSDISSSAPWLFVVDQVEELFILSEDHAATFVAALSSLVARPSPPHRVVLMVRQDYLAALLQLPALAYLSPDALYSPPALDNRELREVIEEPAKKVALKFQDGIIADLISDVIGEPTALPSLQFTLAQLWDHRENDRISWQAYQIVGRPSEALKATAEKAYDALGSDEDKDLARRIFLELVRRGAGTEFVRRRLSRQELTRLVDDAARANRVVDLFVQTGLIRVIAGGEGRDNRFEVAHETLLRNWPRLVSWLDDRSKQSEQEIQLINAVQLWHESGRQSGYLFTGSALKQASKLVASSRELIDAPNVRQFIGASKRYELMTRLKIFGAGALAATIIAAVIPLYVLYSQRREEWLRSQVEADFLQQVWIVKSQDSTPADRGRALKWLAENQLRVPQALRSFDFPGADLTDTDLIGFSLQSPNFAGATLAGVNFDKSLLSAARFIGSTLKQGPSSVDGVARNGRFVGAVLESARFDSAALSSVKFNSASLRFTRFNRARFCGGVDFSGADIRYASFRGVIFEPEYGMPIFTSTVWWLAIGWNLDQARLLSTRYSNVRVEETTWFREDMREHDVNIQNSVPGKQSRADALNGKAWALVTYGVSRELLQQATRLADDAIAIVRGLNEPEVLANVKDTLAYIKLREGDVANALALLTEAMDLLETARPGKAGPSAVSSHQDVVFRYAVALNAVGREEDALAQLGKLSKTYFPSHELHLLREYFHGEFAKKLRSFLEEILSSEAGTLKPAAECPPIETKG